MVPDSSLHAWRTRLRRLPRVSAFLCVLLSADINGHAADAALVAHALAPHSHPRGKTMFSLVSPDDTKVRAENRYADPKMWNQLYQEFLFGAIGTGVAIGDFDNDGLPDLFVVSKTESSHLFHNLGNWNFEDVTEKSGTADHGDAAAIWKQGATFADVNNDGLLDIYVCRFNAPNLLYINQGDGTFRESAHAYGLDVSDSSGMAYFADYDRDGWLDVYIATNLLNSSKHAQGQRGYLLHNNGNGTFTNVTETAGIVGETQSHSAAWWDYDNDGWPDLYVANDFGVADKLYRNNHDGTFTDTIDHVIPHTAFSSMGTDSGDFDNNGLIDLFVADMAATTHQKDQRSIADTRGRFTEMPPDASTVAPKCHRNAVLLNTGTGLCLEAGNLAGLNATDWTWSPRWEDLDNDGRLDLHVTNGMIVEENADVNTRMMSAESTVERIRIMHDSPLLSESHLAFRNRGDLQFENVSAAWGLDQKGVSFGAAFGDFDGDGNLDLVYANYHAGPTLLRNDCDTGHAVMVKLQGTSSNRFGIGATVRIESAGGIQVRQLWLGRGYMSSSEPILHFGLGGDTVIQRMTITWPAGKNQIFENLPVDQRFVVTEPSADALANPTPGSPPIPAQFRDVSETAGLSWLTREEHLDESDQPLIPVRLHRRGPALAVGDVHGDGHEDVVLGGTTLNPLRIVRIKSAPGGEPSSPLPSVTSVPTDDGPILLFDATGRGRADLLVTRGGNTLPAGSAEYQPLLYLNDGHGGFLAAPADTLPALPINVGAVAAADFTRDGRLGIFLGGRVLTGAYPLPPRSALLASHGDHFEDVTDAIAPGLREVGMVTSALWSDVDNDGWPDLLLTLEWGTVKYFHNNEGRSLEDRSDQAGFTSAGTGWWTSLAAADFNGDGRPDYVVGNVGLNTQYHADHDHPALLYSGEFKPGGAMQLVEAYYEGDQLYPWRSRRDLGAVLPALLKRYPRNDTYARATLAEILGKEKLTSAQRFAATELRSGVFMSQPDGSFHFEPLPRLAQIAPLQGLVAGDFDGDGLADIYAVQNAFGRAPVVGRFDGGLSQFLRGDGRGHFEPVPPLESGLIVPGDAKALVVLDLDHDGVPDFVVTRNQSTTLAFHNHLATGRHSLRVALRGPAGNPQGVGSRATLELANGATQTSEVYAGSGYYSQSSADIFFGYTDSNPPRTVHIRWPSGAITSQEVPPHSTVVTLSLTK